MRFSIRSEFPFPTTRKPHVRLSSAQAMRVRAKVELYSAVARDRLAERLADGAGNVNAPVTAAALRDLATVAKQVRTELLNTVVGLTAAELADCDGEVAAHQFTLLGPVH
mgnify:CR=1 FL=1